MKIFCIERYKCFPRVAVPLNSLTILCGANGSGKSSIIQALLLYRAGVRQVHKNTVKLNGVFGLQLGSASNLICQSVPEVEFDLDEMRFGFSDSDGSAPDFLILDTTGTEGVEARSLPVKSFPKNPKFDQRTRFSFTYIAAERVGPRLAQERFSDEELGNQSIGTRGQFTAECLTLNERKKIRPELQFPFPGRTDSANGRLLSAAEQWLSTIVGPISIRVSENGNAPPSLYFKRPGIYNDWVVSTNTGFGITYVLPIIVAGLMSQPGGMLIVDSPEAHLHPAAQTAIAKFLAWVASSGVSVVVETHSDHILDGFRLSAVQKEIPLSADEYSIINIHRDSDGQPTLQNVDIKPDGTLSSWPKGFFDQQTQNFRAIADAVRVSRGN